jgi:flagellar hook protein FlgE
MIRSMSTAVTGLRGHQQKLDVIGNNIANVNTVAFKKSQARFEDLLSQTIQGATAPLTRGGINPSQVGMGMRVSSIVDIHFQGAITSTDRETDLAIEGDGFFIVSDGSREYYTRDGSFGRDAAGELVNANGLKMMGWREEGERTGAHAYPSGREYGRPPFTEPGLYRQS